ncbi:glycosyltransferase family 4 protein [Plantactinospora sonchi]|uniref:Glycosyltransferase family 4 protein n=1 Tax=Plantactinospora sonchi TaxID=1544735 RepID=A0ABU7RR79_9ACTN
MTPWYPTRELPFAGAFVRAMVAATATVWDRATVYHVDAWGAPVGRRQYAAIERAHRELLAHGGVPETGTVADARLRYVPVPVRAGTTFAARANQHAESLRTALGGAPIDAPVVHAHVGLRGGWTALRNARPDARVFVTEHATFLPAVLAEPDSRAMYREVLRRAAGFFTVGEVLRSVLVEAFPEYADRISPIPNPVPFGAVRARPVTEPRRWLFVGTLDERKGVDLLLEAFARCRADDPWLTLTFVGEGRRRPALAARADTLGVADAVTFTGSVPPDRALELIREHDLLVHPSRLETFGMTVVEAVAAGTPVLVTRCGGPEETLAGIVDAAGALVDVDDDPDTIVAGYRRLRDRFPAGLDLAHARTVLAARYGYQAVAEAHRTAWFGDVDPAAPASRAGRAGPAEPAGAGTERGGGTASRPLNGRGA